MIAHPFGKQVIGEGWAAPLKGFMREGALLQTLHFNSLLIDPFNVTGAGVFVCGCVCVVSELHQ